MVIVKRIIKIVIESSSQSCRRKFERKRLQKKEEILDKNRFTTMPPYLSGGGINAFWRLLILYRIHFFNSIAHQNNPPKSAKSSVFFWHIFHKIKVYSTERSEICHGPTVSPLFWPVFGRNNFYWAIPVGVYSHCALSFYLFRCNLFYQLGWYF